MLTKEQAEQVKQELLKQISSFPADQRPHLEQQIMSMDEQGLEEFIKRNQAEDQRQSQAAGQGQQTQNAPQEGQQCIFCSILQGKVPSCKIDENKDNIAILEINPLSKGHALVIPKKHLATTKLPSNAFTLAKKIAKKIKSKFKPKEIKISSQTIMEHALVEVLPLYGDEKERKKATQEELFELQKALITKARKKPVKKPKPENKEGKKLPQLRTRRP